MQVVQADVTTSDGFSCRRDDSSPINPGQKHGAPGERQKPSLLGLINSGCPEVEDVCFNERLFLSRVRSVSSCPLVSVARAHISWL